MLAMVSYSRRPQSGQITCYLDRTYHVLLTGQLFLSAFSVDTVLKAGYRNARLEVRCCINVLRRRPAYDFTIARRRHALMPIVSACCKQDFFLAFHRRALLDRGTLVARM